MTRTVRIGMIVPSSNTCLEPQTYRILRDRTDVTVHFSRVNVTKITLDASGQAQFDTAGMVAAAHLLASAGVDVIAWNGTSGSWLGEDKDRNIVTSITDATGVPATTSTLALFHACDIFGITRIGLVTPYTADVNSAIAEKYRARGVEVRAEYHHDMSVNEEFAGVAPEELLEPSLQVAAAGVDAITYMCTNLYGAPIAARVEGDTGTPVLDSVAVTLWHALELSGSHLLGPGWGRLLEK